MDPFVSEEELRVYLKLPESNLDAKLASMAVDAGCQAVRDNCHQNIETTRTVIWTNGSGSSRLILPYLPVQEIHSLYQDENLVEVEDYRLDKEGGVLIRTHRGIWPRGEENLEIDLTYGYELRNIPTTVKMVALQIAARIYEMGPFETDSIGGAQVMKGASHPNELEQDALYNYGRRL